MVTPLYEREPDCVPGPFYVVKDLCILCALPVQTAPQNIAWDEGECCCQGHGPDHCRIRRQPESEQELTAVLEAMAGSCVEAIRYCGTDPAILQRLRQDGGAHLCDALPEGRGRAA
jgi:hypothetical protein